MASNESRSKAHRGRRVLVTGGTRGIGKGVAQRLASEGASVIVAGRDPDKGAETEVQIAELGGKATFIGCDLKDTGSIPEVVSRARSVYGGIDAFCHAAGVYPERPLAEMTLDAWDEVMTINLTAAMLLVRDVIPDLTRAHNGRIVMISSITGPRTGFPSLSHYAASKGGLEAFVRTASLELAPLGTTVNSVAPGTVMTESLEELYTDSELLRSITSRIPIGRLGTPADVAATVSFLMTTDAGFITGQSITVDGGQTLPEVQY